MPVKKVPCQTDRELFLISNLFQLRIGRAFDGDANPAKVVLLADSASIHPDGLTLVVGSSLADGGNPPAQDMRHVILRAVGGRYDVLGVCHKICQAAGLVGSDVFHGDLIGFGITQCANRCPLQGDYVVCQGEGSAIRRQKQVGGGVGRRDGRCGCGTRRGSPHTKRNQQILAEENIIGCLSIK